MTGNGFLAGLVAITAPSGFVNPMASVDHRPHRRRARVRCPCEFVERVLKLDDPVGAISVHGTNGIWGVIAVGSVRRRQEQLRRLVERRARLGHRPVLRRRRPARGAADRRGDAARLRVHAQLRAQPVLEAGLGPARRRRRSSSKAWTSRKWARSAIRTSSSSPNRPWRTDVSRPCPHALVTTDGRAVEHAAARRFRRFPGGTRTRLARGTRRPTSSSSNRRAWSNPQSADLRTCLGMAHAVNYDVVQVDGRARGRARRRSRRTSGRSSNTPSCTIGCGR